MNVPLQTTGTKIEPSLVPRSVDAAGLIKVNERPLSVPPYLIPS
jgi:hypothetical protein